jgi:preprotein translocase subunit Sec61beta
MAAGRWYCPEYSPERSTEEEVMKAKLDTMALISAAIAVAIWVLIIWTAIAAIAAHI